MVENEETGTVPGQGSVRKQGAGPTTLSTFDKLVLEAARKCGEDGSGNGGILGYLTMLARKYPQSYVKLLQPALMAAREEAEQAKVIDEHVDLSKLSLDELSALYRDELRRPSRN